MKSMTKIISAIAFAAAATVGTNAMAGSVANMERERAIMLQTMLDPNMTQEERHSIHVVPRLRRLGRVQQARLRIEDG